MRNTAAVIGVSVIDTDSRMTKANLTRGRIIKRPVLPCHHIRRTQLVNNLCLVHLRALLK
jgi:hypothetical protein